MNIDQIFLLIDLAQTRSFNKTAERLFTTQQNVSYKIKQLEQELKTTIFLRSSSGVEFTAEGEYVLQCAYEMEKSYRQLKERLQMYDEGGKKRINIITVHLSSVLLSAKMTGVIKSFNAQFPKVKLTIKEVDPDQILNSILMRKCDLAFCSVYKGYFGLALDEHQNKDIAVKLVADDQAIAVISNQSELARKKRLSLHDLSHQPKSVFGVLPVDYFGRNPESFVLYENSNIDIHKQLILEEEAICFTSQKTYDQLFSEPEFTSKQFDYPTLPIEYLLLKQRGANDEEITALAEIICKYLLR